MSFATTTARAVRAVACVVVGALLVLAGFAGPAEQTRPTPTTSWRPATEQERRDRDRQVLEDALTRLWEQRQQPDQRRQDLP